MRDEQGRLVIDRFKRIHKKNATNLEDNRSKHEKELKIRQKLSEIQKSRKQTPVANKKGPSF